MRKLVILIAIVLAVSSAWAQEKRYNVPIGDSPQMGPAYAPVTIIEFIDFQ